MRFVYSGGMAYWLLKTEPSTYSFADLQKEKTTTWTGVANPTAVKHLKAMRKGDVCLVYHTGGEKQVVGVATVVAASEAGEPGLKVGKALKRPVTLAEIKGDAAFAGYDLLRIGRLSVVPTPAEMYKRILDLSEEGV